MSQLAIPAERTPRGWWQVGWSHDIAAGEVKQLKYFGQDLVMWRGMSGGIALQDAYCLHLGANRAVRGWVTDDDLTCPWHGWQWDSDGRNTCIPYSADKCKPRLKIRTYPTQEWYGMIYAWWAPDGREPEWQLPEIPELDDDRYYPMHPTSGRVHRIKAHTQAVFENTVDPYHVPYVHGAKGTPARITRFETDGHRLSISLAVIYGEGRASTPLTPDGPVEETLLLDFYGMGVGTLRWTKVWPTVCVSGASTPVDDTYCDYYFQQTSLRVDGDTGDEFTGIPKMLLDHQHVVITQDFFTWENMTMLDKPNFVTEEAANYAALRRWARQFYSDGELERRVEAADLASTS